MHWERGRLARLGGKFSTCCGRDARAPSANYSGLTGNLFTSVWDFTTGKLMRRAGTV